MTKIINNIKDITMQNNKSYLKCKKMFIRCYCNVIITDEYLKCMELKKYYESCVKNNL